MGSFQIKGGKKLKGEIIPQGAKNEALQVVCAVLMTSEKVTLHNLPDIRDVNFLIDLLEELGVKVNRPGNGTVHFQSNNIDINSSNRTVQKKSRITSWLYNDNGTFTYSFQKSLYA